MNATALALRARANLATKVGMALALHLIVGVPYFVLQRTPVFPITWMPEVGVEQFVPFDERATWLYLSLFVFILLPPLFMQRTQELRRYATGMVLIAMVSHTFFFLLPTAVARPHGSVADPAYRFLLSVDTPLNACPSLHASLAVYSALWAARLLRQARQPGRWHVLTWLWTAAILYATLATRQHVLLDLLGGGLVAVVVYRAIVSPAAAWIGGVAVHETPAATIDRRQWR
jgi:hypothetical protein